MSIREYMKTLNYDQLVVARNIADEFIKEKDEEKRVTLWSVQTKFEVFGYFENYIDAANRLHKKAEELNSGVCDYLDKAISVCFVRVRESEVRDYIDA